jgi:hypothetical protein
MSRQSTVALLALSAAVLLPATAALAQGTIRVEPRPFYGAVVTIEEGVRVFRPLPPDRYVVINPGHQTPLSLGIQDTTVYERREIHNYNHDSGRGGSGGGYSLGGGGVYPGYAVRDGRAYGKRGTGGVNYGQRRPSRGGGHH